jgi:predicted RNase H-like nuclease (RuvC/YqgF family)
MKCVAIEMALFLVTQLDSHITQLKERVEVTADSIENIMKRLEELKNDLTNDVRKKDDPTQICQQEKGILKRVKEEGDDGHQLVDCTRRRNKRARVAWEN